MQDSVAALRALSSDLDVHGPEPSVVARLGDRDLIRAVGLAISRPKRDRVSSFLLHAPLELFARAALLPSVSSSQRSACRIRIARIAALYAEGDEIVLPSTSFADVGHATAVLDAALRDGDADSADVALTFLVAHLSFGTLRGLLTDRIAPCLGAAAHLPLLLAEMGDANAAFGDLSLLLRAPVRMVAARPDLRLSWIDASIDGAPSQSLWAVLARAASVTVTGDAIAPMMLAVEREGVAGNALGQAVARCGIDTARTLSRIAALSMITDSPHHAPYGWTHCLTLPQGLLRLEPSSARPERLRRIAATFVLGFRAALGTVPLEERNLPTVSPPPAGLAGYAAAHEDAHLAKYVVACRRASAADPSARALFATAAHRLATWWRAHSAD